MKLYLVGVTLLSIVVTLSLYRTTETTQSPSYTENDLLDGISAGYFCGKLDGMIELATKLKVELPKDIQVKECIAIRSVVMSHVEKKK